MTQEMTINTLKGTTVLLVIFIIWMVTTNSRNYFENKRNYQKTVDSLSNQITMVSERADSLSSEIFIYETNLNRYQITLEMLENENPEAASEFNKRLSMTE
jgi:peptidoglycan hydrolase CwlO-like protein